MAKRTPIYRHHLEHNATMVDFAGWEMPLHYGSQLEEHKRVREDAGVFDVSHMNSISIQGAGTTRFLRLLLCGDVSRLKPGKGFYSCMLNEQGGVLDDLVVYRLAKDNYLMVVNAATANQDLDWLNKHKSEEVLISSRTDYCIFALQGPYARDRFHEFFTQHSAASELTPFSFLVEEDVFISCTGYTGEDGYELIMPYKQAENYWQQLVRECGIAPCGLGCRDTLRLEAGMALYGNDLDQQHTPLDSGIQWTVHWEDDKRNFIGKKALSQAKEKGVKEKMVGLILNDSGIIRRGNRVFCSTGEGTVTSGSFSPTLNCSIALARIPRSEDKKQCEIEVREKRLRANIVKPPFIKKKKPLA